MIFTASKSTMSSMNSVHITYMYNLGNFAALCILTIAYRNQVVGKISSSDEIQGIVGQDAIFMFNTTNGGRILGVKFGIDGGRNYPYPKLITVIYKEGKSVVICSYALDKIIAARYKHRVFFNGNLAIGHAWFVITNISLSDTNQYRVSIREHSDDTYRQKKSVKLTVKHKASTPPSTSLATSSQIILVPSTSKRSDPRYTAFKGIAEKGNSTEESPKVLLDAIQAAYNSISNVYKIRITSFKFRKKTKMLQARFRISFTKAINQTYAHSFLQVAEQNNHLEGYKITCFDVLKRQKPKRKKGENPSTTSPWKIAAFVLLAMVIVILIFILMFAVYKCGVCDHTFSWLRNIVKRA